MPRVAPEPNTPPPPCCRVLAASCLPQTAGTILRLRLEDGQVRDYALANALATQLGLRPCILGVPRRPRRAPLLSL